MNTFYLRGLGIFTFAMLTACVTAPVGPSPGVTAGLGKSDADFLADVNACKAVAAEAVKDVVKAANQQVAVGGMVNMAAGGTAGDAAKNGLAASQDAQGSVQQQYDAAYGPCMFKRGNNVPGMEPLPPPPPPPPPEHVVVRDPLVMQVQQALVQLGYLHSGPDGVAGKKTAAAISQFETDKGMTVDGVSSRNLLAALRAAEASGGAMPPPPAAGGAMPPPPAGAMPPPPGK